MLQKLQRAVLVSSLVIGAPAIAQEESEPHFFGGNFSANVAITTDYRFRGVSQTFGDPAVQGGFDWASDIFYVGVWGSTVDFAEDFTDPFTGEFQSGASAEIDLYFGLTPSIGDLSLDFGFIYYLYPSAVQDGDDIVFPAAPTPADIAAATALGFPAAVPGDVLLDNPDQNYIELKAGGSYPVGPAEIGFNLTYSPDYYFETGNVLIPDVSLSVPLGGSTPFAGSEISFSASGNVSYLAFLDDLNPPGTFGEDYGTFGVGVTATWFGIDFDARWIDNFGDTADFGSTGVFTISKGF